MTISMTRGTYTAKFKHRRNQSFEILNGLLMYASEDSSYSLMGELASEAKVDEFVELTSSQPTAMNWRVDVESKFNKHYEGDWNITRVENKGDKTVITLRSNGKITAWEKVPVEGLSD